MLRQNIINAIDKVSESIIDSDINVCEALLDSYNKGSYILENYEGDDVSSFSIFSESYVMEAKTDKKNDKKENNDGILKTVVKKIRDAIAKLIAMIFKKLGCTGFDPDKVGTSDRSVKAGISKLKNIERKHPILAGSIITIGGTAGILGSAKLAIKAEKKLAMKGFDEHERDTINDTFDNNKGILKMPIDIVSATKFLTIIKEKYKALCEGKVNILANYGTDKPEEKLPEDKVKSFVCETKGPRPNLRDVYKAFDRIDQLYDQFNINAFADTTIECYSITEWDDNLKKFYDACKNDIGCDELTAYCSAVSTICFGIQARGDSYTKTEETDKMFNKIEVVSERIARFLSELPNCHDKLVELTKLMGNYLKKYFAIEDTAKRIINNVGTTAANMADTAMQIHELNKK